MVEMEQLTLGGNTYDLRDASAQSALLDKVDKVSGKGLSTNDYTTDERNKLAGVASGATANAASNTTPKAAGTAAVGSEAAYARGDHVHPAQTSVTGNAGTATKLAAAKTIQTKLDSTAASSFDGSANVTPGVMGTLPIANGGTGQTTAAGVRNALGLGNTTGALPIANGGTGATTAEKAAINIMADGSSETSDTPNDNTFFYTTRQDGFSTNKTIYRRSAAGVWEWIKTKIQAAALVIANTLTANIFVAKTQMTTAAGKVSGLTASTSRVYGNGFAMSNPATINDQGWIRTLGTGEADTVLEIATGDDGGSGEQIVARQYNTSNAVANEAVLLGIGGTTKFPKATTIGNCTLTPNAATNSLDFIFG